MSSSSLVTTSLEYALNRVAVEFKDMTDGQEMIDKITIKFEHTCNNPPTKDFEFLLRKPFTDDEVCVALFKPRDEQVEYFAALLVAIQSLPGNHPTHKLAPLLVSLLFLVHRKDWGFMKTFICCNGLVSLIGYIDSENLYLRGQILETILCATDCDIYDWFKPPDSHADKVLHTNMMVFSRSNATMTKLFANRTGSYPGGSFRALQIIAFTLSWIRALYTADQKLQLSENATTYLKLWATPNQSPKEGDLQKEQDQQDPEIQLADALLEDFLSTNNLPTPPQSSTSISGADDSDRYVTSAIDTSSLQHADLSGTECEKTEKNETNMWSQGPDDSKSMAVAAAADDLAPLEPPTITASTMKEKGNVDFKSGRYGEAREWYKKALTTIECVASTTSSDLALRVALYSNSATASWKLAQDNLSRQPELELLYHTTNQSALRDHCGLEAVVSFEKYLDECIEDCTSALRLHPYCTKAAYRLAAVYLLRQESIRAIEVVVQCLGEITKLKAQPYTVSTPALDNHVVFGEKDDIKEMKDSEGEESGSFSGADEDLLYQMKRKCLAAVLLAQKEASVRGANKSVSAGVDPAQSVHSLTGELLTGKTSEILKNLLVQYQIELDIPLETDRLLPSAVTLDSINDTNPKTKSKLKLKPIAAHTSGVTHTISDTSTARSGKDTIGKAKKKKASASGSSSSSSMAKRLQEIDDNMLESLMKRGSIKA